MCKENTAEKCLRMRVFKKYGGKFKYQIQNKNTAI